MMFK
jgi:dynein heavy chain, axonemal